MSSRELMQLLLNAGWVLTRIKGPHHIFHHPAREGHVCIPHPRKDLGTGLVHAIKKQAGLE